MAIVNCKECGKEISDMAQTCPHCGVVIKKDTYTKEISTAKKVAIFFITVLILIIGYFFITGYWIPSHTHPELVNGKYVTEFRLFE